MSSHHSDHSDGDRSPPPSPRSARSTTSRRATRAPRSPAGEITRLEQDLRSTQATRATLFRDRNRLNDIVNRLNTELQDLERHRWGQEDEIRRLRTEIDDLQRASNGGSTQLIQDLRLQVDQQAAEMLIVGWPALINGYLRPKRIAIASIGSWITAWKKRFSFDLNLMIK
ncbi:hypothetical protein PF011_g28114 [Phytophthora fragariae]|uniref:Uncharacterized protein n=1 Tax=Phytophthora fragariae TaxID=53985 RepID=A0A6A3H8W5_9STRA|nr:hypothetical protein PF011_g28114 [Phytophthora fragariae]